MSKENVEIVRRVYEPQLAVTPRPSSLSTTPRSSWTRPGSGSPVSREGAGASTGGTRACGPGSASGTRHGGNIEYDFEELIDAGKHVISVVTRRARGRTSGVEVERPFALVWTLREGKVVRVVWFLTRAEALEAAGPPE